jgi:broad specificity phosphatase PhoE
MTGTCTLDLIRHAMPVVDYEKPPATWELSEQGAADSRLLAEELQDLGLIELVSSVEPKAAGTAREIAGVLGIEWRTAPGLHEHERDPLPYFGDVEWHTLVRGLFDHPDELMMGRETANAALARFSRAVDEVLADSVHDKVGIVSHGTVMSLYASQLTGEAPYSIWSRLTLPDYVLLTVELTRTS